MEENQIVVDVGLTHLSKSMSLELNKLGGQPNENEIDNFTIFPVPYEFRQSKKNLFDPSVVSIGPLHHGKESLKAMQDQKWRFLQDFLSRGDHITLDLCLSEIKNLEEKTRRCYSESVPLDSNSFVEMMLLDGCFVLEYFLKWYERRLIGFVFELSDLVLLENQIPFFIVEKLCEIGLKPQDRIDFTNYLVHIFAQAAPADDSIVQIHPAEIHHFIHLCYHSLIPINPTKPVVSSSESFFPSMLRYRLSVPKSTLIPCATDIRNGGIILRAKSNPDHMLDISFDHNILEIPRLTITNQSKTLLANLIAFEQYKSDKMSANLSSFALFLYSLVKTPEDVKILQRCGIVNNYLDSDKELIDFFNQIWKGMVVEKNHLLAKLFLEVNKYCESSWSRNRRELIEDYFRNPMDIINLYCGVFLVLVLTFLQTFFAIYAYYVPPRNHL